MSIETFPQTSLGAAAAAVVDRLTADQIKAVLDYDPASGFFRWKPRTPDMFSDGNVGAKGNCASFNKKYAGQIANSAHIKGYTTVRVFRRSYLCHRLAWLFMTGEWPTHEIDHINGDRGDNRFENLREATALENHQNLKFRSTNTSGLVGAFLDKRDGRRAARICVARKYISLGRFDTAHEAHEAYLAAKAQYHPFQPVPRFINGGTL